MDLATISQELNKRFLAPLPEFYKRKLDKRSDLVMSLVRRNVSYNDVLPLKTA